MDLEQLDTETNHWNDQAESVVYQDGKPELDSQGNIVKFFILSEFSKPRRRLDREHRQRYNAFMRLGATLDKMPDEDQDRMQIERVAACVSGWQGFESGAAPYPYSPENAVVLLTKFRERRPDQFRKLETDIQAHADFFKVPSAA